MNEPKHAPGWTVTLEGDRFDVDKLLDMLPPAFDPSAETLVEDDRTTTALLRSRNWTNAWSAREVFLDAQRLVTKINGAMLLFDTEARPISAPRIFRFDADGTRHHVLVAITGNLNVRLQGMRLKATGTTGGPPLPPAESKLQELLRRAESDDKRASLLSQLASIADWYDLYMLIEIAQKVLGKGVKSGKWPEVRRRAAKQRHWDRPRLSEGQFNDDRAFVIAQISRLLLERGM